MAPTDPKAPRPPPPPGGQSGTPKASTPAATAPARPATPPSGTRVPAIAPLGASKPAVPTGRPPAATPGASASRIPKIASVVPQIAPTQAATSAPLQRTSSPGARPPTPAPVAASRPAGLPAEVVAKLPPGVDLTAVASLSTILDEVDYFQLLKIERTASLGEIKAAFYRESRAYHPDRFFQVPDEALKSRVSAIYKRVTEAYYVLRDDTKRKRYVADISGTERANKLRFSDATEAEAKAAAMKEQVEQIGLHPKGRQFYKTALADCEAGRWAAAERNLKMALTYERENALYKEKLAEVLKQLKAK